jgi:hypothetical protein
MRFSSKTFKRSTRSLKKARKAKKTRKVKKQRGGCAGCGPYSGDPKGDAGTYSRMILNPLD